MKKGSLGQSKRQSWELDEIEVTELRVKAKEWKKYDGHNKYDD